MAMTTVLVVDDVEDYGEELSFGLTRDGHHVVLATSAREAIDVGTMLRPDVVVSDWMLKDHVNGLDVVHALSVVFPSLRAILMTGFASTDLRMDAKNADIFDFLEKPLQLGQVREVVRRAADTDREWKQRERIGFIEVESDGTISYANQCAEEMMGTTRAGTFAQHLTDLFVPTQCDLLAEASEQWVEVTPSTVEPAKWLVRSRKQASSSKRMYVLLDEEHAAYRSSPLVCRLLGLSEPRIPIRVPMDGHILILDDFESVRRVTVDILRELNYICHTARSQEEAIRLFSHDADIRVVILDFEIPNTNPREVIQTLRRLRPNVHIIGTSGGQNSAVFSNLRVHTFLQKPWDLEQFFKALAGPVH